MPGQPGFFPAPRAALTTYELIATWVLPTRSRRAQLTVIPPCRCGAPVLQSDSPQQRRL